jgi:hypothetical protein
MWCKNADDGQIRELLIISTQAKRRGQRRPASRSRRPGGSSASLSPRYSAVNALNICRPLMSDPEIASALIQCVGRVTRL